MNMNVFQSVNIKPGEESVWSATRKYEVVSRIHQL